MGHCRTDSQSPISNGVKQGCVLAPTSFSIFFSIMFRQAKQDLPDGIYIRLPTDVFNLRRLLARTKTIKEFVTALLFADDCALLATTKEALSSKIRLIHFLVTSIFLFARESWTLTAELQRIRAMEMKCYRKILRISYKNHLTDVEVRAKIQQEVGPHEDLLTIVQRRKLKWYGHVSRSLGWPKPSCEA